MKHVISAYHRVRKHLFGETVTEPTPTQTQTLLAGAEEFADSLEQCVEKLERLLVASKKRSSF